MGASSQSGLRSDVTDARKRVLGSMSLRAVSDRHPHMNIALVVTRVLLDDELHQAPLEEAATGDLVHLSNGQLRQHLHGRHAPVRVRRMHTRACQQPLRCVHAAQVRWTEEAEL